MTTTMTSQADYLAPTARAREIAQNIRSIRQIVVTLAEQLDAQLMENLWLLRQEFSGEDIFLEFVQAELQINPKEAQRRVIAWDGARKNRQLRELANREPQDALKLIGQLTAGDYAIEDDDPQITEILLSPPKKRARTLKALLEAAPTGAAPIEAARPERRPAAAPADDPVPAGEAEADAAELIDYLASVVAGFTARQAAIKRMTPSQTQCRRIVKTADKIQDYLDALAGAASDGLA